ncbi:hypothetical protein E2C01_102326 [Portunus trituberculatus]|uniref:Uncharacterized protein n=1 Tax=Portunus trituberculatus TaxID=210409 RepID=A0A5B7K7W6_PORTR|nr:hypothetical protein [Portunus trituberculatus]
MWRLTGAQSQTR